MNPKITKLRTEFEKNKRKISDLQGRNRELEKQIRELEDTDIIGMVRENGMTMEQFAELFRRMQARLPRSLLNRRNRAMSKTKPVFFSAFWLLFSASAFSPSPPLPAAAITTIMSCPLRKHRSGKRRRKPKPSTPAP